MQSLALLCADAGLALGRSPSEVAATLSLPEALLVLRRDQEHRMEELRLATHSRALAAAAIWSKQSAQALQNFEASLRPKREQPKQASDADLRRMFGRAGVQPNSSKAP